MCVGMWDHGNVATWFRWATDSRWDEKNSGGTGTGTGTGERVGRWESLIASHRLGAHHAVAIVVHGLQKLLGFDGGVAGTGEELHP